MNNTLERDVKRHVMCGSLSRVKDGVKIYVIIKFNVTIAALMQLETICVTLTNVVSASFLK